MVYSNPDFFPLCSCDSFLFYFIDYAITVVPFSFSPLFPSILHCPSHHHSPCHLSLCPWVIHVSYLASPFPILFLTSPCLLCTYHLCFLFPVPFPAYYLLTIPTNNPPCDLYFCDSVTVLDVSLVCFIFRVFFFRFSC